RAPTGAPPDCEFASGVTGRRTPPLAPRRRGVTRLRASGSAAWLPRAVERAIVLHGGGWVVVNARAVTRRLKLLGARERRPCRTRVVLSAPMGTGRRIRARSRRGRMSRSKQSESKRRSKGAGSAREAKPTGSGDRKQQLAAEALPRRSLAD